MSMVGRFVGQSDSLIPKTYNVWDNYPTSSIAQYPIRQGPTGVGVLDFRLQRQGQRGGVSQMLHKFWCRKSEQRIDESIPFRLLRCDIDIHLVNMLNGLN